MPGKIWVAPHRQVGGGSGIAITCDACGAHDVVDLPVRARELEEQILLFGGHHTECENTRSIAVANIASGIQTG